MYPKNSDLPFYYTMLMLVFAVITCSRRDHKTASKGEEIPMTIQLTSSVFTKGTSIPSNYTCDGEDVSPPLNWSNVPQNTKSFALICDDPDAPMGTWVHWVLYNIPPTITALPEDMPRTEIQVNGTKQGINDFRRLGYGGPCPPRGGAHRYFFKLYALDTELDLKPGVSKRDLLRAMGGHILAEGQLMGTYKRR